MGRDGELALAIGVVMIAIVVGGLLFSLVLGRTVARRLGWSSHKRLLITLGLGVIGAGTGALIVTTTFYEDTWSPPPQITLNVTPDFKQEWVILLEDPKASTQLLWEGIEMPFFGKTTVIDVPTSGVVRVRELNELRRPGTIQWSDGSCSTGYSEGVAPTSTDAIRYMAFERLPKDCSVRHSLLPDGEALGAYITARESER